MRHLANHRGALRHVWWLVALLVLLMTVYVVVAREVMKQLPEWRAPLEEFVQNQTQLPLTIGHLSGYMQGLTPVFVLEDVQLASSEQQSLTVDKVTVAADLLMSALHRSVWLRELKISGLDIELVQQADKHVELSGFPRKADAAKPQNASLQGILKLLYQQKLLIIDDLRLHLKLNQVPEIITQGARFEMRSSGSQHQVALRLQTQEHPVFIDARLSLSKSVYDYTDLTGKGYLSLEGDDLAYWLASIWPTEVKPVELAGRLGVWFNFDRGQASFAQIATDIDQLTLSDGKAAWQANGVEGRFALKHDRGYQFQVEALDFDSSAGRWLSGPMGLSWNGTDPATADWKLSLSQVDLSRLVNGIVEWPFVLPKEVVSLRNKLAALQPEAVVESLYVAGTGQSVSHLSGQLTQVGLQAQDKIPGLQGLNVRFSGNANEGIALLDSSQITLDLQDLYEQPVSAIVSGGLHWQKDKEGRLSFYSNRWLVDSEDGQGELLMSVTAEPKKMPKLHLLADISSERLDHADFYIPFGKMPDGLAHWLRGAVPSGRVPLGRFLVEGPAKVDADRHQDRTFQMQFTVADAELRFLEGWPHLTEVDGTILIDDHLAVGKGISGLFYNSPFSQAAVNVKGQDGTTDLQISGQVKGEAQDVSRLFRQTPLKEQLPKEIVDWQLLSGQIDGSLALGFELHHDVPPSSSVTVEANAQGLGIRNAKRRFALDDVGGQVRFDLHGGITVDSLVGNWLGEPFVGAVQTQNDAILITTQGALAITPLAEWLGADWLTNAQGKAEANANIILPWKNQRPVELLINSDLAGVAINLPKPYSKAAASKAPFSMRLVNAEQLHFQYKGTQPITGRMQLKEGEVRSGIIRSGRDGPAALPVSKVVVDAVVPAIDAKAWVDWIANQTLTDDKQKAGGKRLPLQRLQLEAQTFDVFGVKATQATLDIVPTESAGWRFDFNSPELAGRLIVPDNYTMRGERPLDIAIEQLHLPASDGFKNEAGSFKPLAPSDVPVADVQINTLSWGEQQVNQLKGKLRPNDQGLVVSGLSGRWKRARFNGEFEWLHTNQGQLSHYKGEVVTDDLKRLQRDLGFDEVVVSDEEAKAKVDITWVGTLLDFDYQALTGKGDFSVGSCRLPNLDKNSPLMRVLGALNMGSISRRLRLDFSDVYKKGFSCDSIKGDLAFDQQHIDIKKLHMKSPSADISMKGTANIADQTLDSDVTVVLPLSSNLYAGCLAGPAACAGIFVFERLLGDRLEKAVALHYRLTGNWFEPTIKEAK